MQTHTCLLYTSENPVVSVAYAIRPHKFGYSPRSVWEKQEENGTSYEFLEDIKARISELSWLNLLVP